MAALPPEELPELMLEIANASIKRTTRCLIEWQLHTMTRPAEAATTRWIDIDFERRVWTIPHASALTWFIIMPAAPSSLKSTC